ncbi:MAG: twin-arginine translocase TatA/TatE family subunit [Gemmataceae bacterium]
MSPLLASILSGTDWLIIAAIGVLLFGVKRLPEFGRSLGKGIVEFKKGLKGLEDDESDSSSKSEPRIELHHPPQRITQAAPRFEDRPVAPPTETSADKPNTPT